MSAIRELHGLSWRNGKRTKLHYTWLHIRQRCSNPNDAKYPIYGGRGIKVCPRWDRFTNFYEDMGEPPTPKHSIERVDNDGDYSPMNCRWATMAEQAVNRRNVKLTAADIAEIRRRYKPYVCTQRQLAKEYGVTVCRIAQLTTGPYQ